jgi:homoserine dehydrogenase
MNNIALFGYGTVGKGVRALLDSQKKELGIDLKYVFDLPSKKEELGALLCTDYHQILNDESLAIVIECLGGDQLPHQVIKEALEKGKHVISSNKETIAEHLPEYLAAAKKSGATIQFEASCGGGIPLLYPLYNISRFDEITSIRGILNGTTNYILTEMQRDSCSFEEALREAQKRGFAEKDPSADLDGLDVLRKTRILASVIFGAEISSKEIPVFGIGKAKAEYLAYFAGKNKTVKLISELKKTAAGQSLIVLPEALDLGDPLADVNYELNGIEAFCLHNGPLFFTGPGAGQNPTASAILQDLIRVLSSSAPRLNANLKKEKPNPDLSGLFWGFKEGTKPALLTNPSLESLKKFNFVVREKEGR